MRRYSIFLPEVLLHRITEDSVILTMGEERRSLSVFNQAGWDSFVKRFKGKNSRSGRVFLLMATECELQPGGMVEIPESLAVYLGIETGCGDFTFEYDSKKTEALCVIRYQEESMVINGRQFTRERLLGKGKGGYSYLVSDGSERYVMKQIHHEPCSYYQFGNKIESEINDYRKLMQIGIRMPAMLDVDLQKECILKEYIEGDTVYDLIIKGQMQEEYLEQVREMCRKVYGAGINIDYFPTNFVVRDGMLYYIDFECNDYMEEWNFENWGIKYWSKTPEFMQYLKEHAGGNGICG